MQGAKTQIHCTASSQPGLQPGSAGHAPPDSLRAQGGARGGRAVSQMGRPRLPRQRLRASSGRWLLALWTRPRGPLPPLSAPATRGRTSLDFVDSNHERKTATRPIFVSWKGTSPLVSLFPVRRRRLASFVGRRQPGWSLCGCVGEASDPRGGTGQLGASLLLALGFPAGRRRDADFRPLLPVRLLPGSARPAASPGGAMSKYVNDLWPGSLADASPCASRSGQSSRRTSASRSRSSSRSSRSSDSGRASSRGRRGPRRRRRSSRSRSRSRSGRRPPRKYRRYSRSYSRSRSRARRRRARRSVSCGRAARASPRGRAHSRSRSRSRGRSYARRATAGPRGRRYYGFGRTGFPEERRGWRGRSRTRSRSRTPFRLSEKDRMELLEIAKANAAKALGTANLDLPASLRNVSLSKTSLGLAVPNGAKFELSEKLTEDEAENHSEKSSQQKSIAFSSNNSVAKPMMLQKPAQATVDENSSRSPKIDKKKSPYGLWIPV